jgi:tetratricopeptide (TPR) repeat protein
LAVEDFNQILKIKPNDINALNWRTIFYDRNNDIENAVKGYKNIISLVDSIKKLEYKIEDYGWANINLAEIYQCEGKIEEALNLYNEGISYMPNYPKGYYWRAWFFALYISKYDDAVSDFSSALELEPENPYWYLNRSKIYQIKGDQKNAKNDLDDAVKISKESAIYIAERGNYYSQIRDFQKAKKEFDKAVRLDSTNSRILNYITEDFIRQGEKIEAIKHAQQTIEQFNHDTVSYEQLGRIYLSQNEFQKALFSYSQAAAIMEFNEGDRTIYPHDVQVFLSDIYLKISELYMNLNQPDLCCEALIKANKIIKNETRPNRQKTQSIIEEKLKECTN